MGRQDTSIGAGRSAFGRSRWTDILNARHGSPEQIRALLDELSTVYWRPVYKFIRVALRKENEDAKDLTQDFFAVVFGPEWLARADPDRGTFRTFLLASLKNFVRDREKYRGARKRGGGLSTVPLDALAEEPSPEQTPEQVFQRSWAESMLHEALRELEQTLVARGRQNVFQAFREYCLGADDVSYRSIGQRLGLSETDVTNYLSEARRELRRILAGRVGQYVDSPRQIDVELRALFEA
jgi:RNA polymerase sigma-70 factor (ECF subfamily)